MDEWQKQIQVLILEIDECIKRKEDEALTLSALAKKLGFSEFYVSRKFREVPEQMQLMDVEEGTYLVFEHGPFDFATQNQMVEQKIEEAMKNFDYISSGYELDTTQGRVFYFYHDCKRFWKYVRPVKKTTVHETP